MVNQTLIEKYQQILLKDKKSRVFAPLAEAYRKMGWLKEAQATCEQGIKFNPNFSGGYVALAKIYLDLNKTEKALEALDRSIRLNAENLLAHQLRAELQLRLKNPKEALRSYKMVLFLSPQHSRALQAVKKLESLTAEDYDEEVFELRQLKPAAQTIDQLQSPLIVPTEDSAEQFQFDPSEMERTLSLVDALIVRNEFQKANERLANLRAEFNQHPEIQKRLDLLNSRGEPTSPLRQPYGPLARDIKLRQIKAKKLERLLERLAQRQD